MNAPVILWFRNDLRLADNPALFDAARSGNPIIALYVYETDAERALGGASQWWLHQSLTRLSEDLRSKGLPLVLRRGSAEKILSQLIKDTGAATVMWNRRYDQGGIARDTHIKQTLTDTGVKVESFKGNLLNEPWEIKTQTGGYYKVFSPYWRAVLRCEPPAPALSAPDEMAAFSSNLDSQALEDFGLLPTHPDWASKMAVFWKPGEIGAAEALNTFLVGPAENYKTGRDLPDRAGTSRLSPHLAFGEISPRQIWHIARRHEGDNEKFLSEIGWREFSYNLLFHNPDLASVNFKSDFDRFEWQGKTEHLKLWQHGLTGYPFVDAGMRELWATGWQHNRVRMVTASFLIKHLMLDWRLGEAWFWDTLLDADPANNAASWQWVAGSGADAAPYFRIFNPFGQGEKFDSEGKYVRRWIPEISRLPNKFIHKPWEAPALVLQEAGVTLGETYPKPLVDHKFARERALDAYKAMRE